MSNAIKHIQGQMQRRRKKAPSKIMYIMKRLAVGTIIVLVGIGIGITYGMNNPNTKKISDGKDIPNKPQKGYEYVKPPQSEDTLPGTQNNVNEVVNPLVKGGDEPGTENKPDQALSDLLDAAPYDLIPQHQESYEKTYINGYKPLATRGNKYPQFNFEASVPSSTLNRMRNFTTDFVKQYETFNNNESYQRYARSLQHYVTQNNLGIVASRTENHQPQEIALRHFKGINGSRFDGALNPRQFFQVLRYEPGSFAYVTTLAAIKYTGPGGAWKNSVEKRSYGIILVPNNGRWQVARVSSDTLGPLN